MSKKYRVVKSTDNQNSSNKYSSSSQGCSSSSSQICGANCPDVPILINIFQPFTITQSGTYVIPPNTDSFSYIIIGGSGGGGSGIEYKNGRIGGGGGAAGQVKSNSVSSAQPGRLITIIIGEAGEGGKISTSRTDKFEKNGKGCESNGNGTSGTTTTLKYNGDSFNAIGGGGGFAAKNGVPGAGGDYPVGTTVNLSLDSGDPGVKINQYVGGEGGIVNSAAIPGTRGGFGGFAINNCQADGSDGQSGVVSIQFIRNPYLIPPLNNTPIELLNFEDSDKHTSFVTLNPNIPQCLASSASCYPDFIKSIIDSAFIHVNVVDVAVQSSSQNVSTTAQSASLSSITTSGLFKNDNGRNTTTCQVIGGGGGGANYISFLLGGVGSIAGGGAGASSPYLQASRNLPQSPDLFEVRIGTGRVATDNDPTPSLTKIFNHTTGQELLTTVASGNGSLGAVGLDSAVGGIGGSGGWIQDQFIPPPPAPPAANARNPYPGQTGGAVRIPSKGAYGYPIQTGATSNETTNLLASAAQGGPSSFPGGNWGSGGNGGGKIQFTASEYNASYYIFSGIQGQPGVAGAANIPYSSYVGPSTTSSGSSSAFSTSSSSLTSLVQTPTPINYLVKIPAVLFTAVRLAAYVFPTIHINANLFKDAQNTSIRYNADTKSLTISHKYTQDVIFPVPKGIHNIDYEIKGGDGAYFNNSSATIGQLLRGTSSVLEGSLLTLKVGPGGEFNSEFYQNGRTTKISGFGADGKAIGLVAGGGKGMEFGNQPGEQGYIKLTIHVFIANLL